jgi:hypothetical protein
LGNFNFGQFFNNKSSHNFGATFFTEKLFWQNWATVSVIFSENHLIALVGGDLQLCF